MAQWLVTKGNTQFAVSGLAELQKLARAGELSGGDMIQPPGTTEWLYAAEVPQLEALLPKDVDLDDDDFGRSKSNGMVTAALVAVFGALLAGGGYYAMQGYNDLGPSDVKLVGADAFTKMIVVGTNAVIRSGPEASAGQIGIATKDATVELLSKRGDYYKARLPGGEEGWLAKNDVLPLYKLGDKDMKAEYDPLYNPDAYVFVQNASWMQLPEQREAATTVFNIGIKNSSQYDVTDLVLEATIQDSNGHELETVEFPVEGIVPAHSTTMAGTLTDAEAGVTRLITEATKAVMAEADPNVNLQYSSGCEVTMTSEDFTNARVKVIELRAIPKG